MGTVESSGDVHSVSTGQSYVSNHPPGAPPTRERMFYSIRCCFVPSAELNCRKHTSHLSQLVDAASVCTRLPTEATLPRSTNAADTITAPWPVCSGSQQPRLGGAARGQLCPRAPARPGRGGPYRTVRGNLSTRTESATCAHRLCVDAQFGATTDMTRANYRLPPRRPESLAQWFSSCPAHDSTDQPERNAGHRVTLLAARPATGDQPARQRPHQHCIADVLSHVPSASDILNTTGTASLSRVKRRRSTALDSWLFCIRTESRSVPFPKRFKHSRACQTRRFQSVSNTMAPSDMAFPKRFHTSARER